MTKRNKILNQECFTEALLVKMNSISQSVYFEEHKSILWDQINFKVEYLYEHYLNYFTQDAVRALDKTYETIKFFKKIVQNNSIESAKNLTKIQRVNSLN